MPEPKRESCICAAIRMPNGLILTGHRHHNIIKLIHDLGLSKLDARNQGFMTTRGKFVDRTTGRELQKRAGIASASPDGYRGQELYSEDLY